MKKRNGQFGTSDDRLRLYRINMSFFLLQSAIRKSSRGRTADVVGRRASQTSDDRPQLFRTNVSFFLPRSAIRKSSLWEDSRRSRQEGIAYQRLFYRTIKLLFSVRVICEDSSLEVVEWSFQQQFIDISPKKKNLREEETVGCG